MAIRKFEVYRGNAAGGKLEDYDVEVEQGMVVLDAIFRIQATDSPDLAVRWNCKAGKCGSCSCEINGRPKLACMTRISDYDEGESITVTPMKAFPVIKDLVTDVSHNYRANEKIPQFKPRPKDAEDGWRMYQYEVDKAQEMRKCIECFLCQDVCHVLRSHAKHDEFVGPAFMVRTAAFSMNPIDEEDRLEFLKDEGGIGYCNITKCCTEVCPEHITITDNAIIPLKERVVDRYYDPIKALVRMVRGGRKKTG